MKKLQNTVSTFTLGGKIEFLRLGDDKVRGCPGKRLLNLTNLLELEARANDALRETFVEDCNWDRLCEFATDLPLYKLKEKKK